MKLMKMRLSFNPNEMFRLFKKKKSTKFPVIKDVNCMEKTPTRDNRAICELDFSLLNIRPTKSHAVTAK